MLLRLFGDYLMVINQPTRQSTASELLNVIQDKVDMAPYQESSLYKKYQNSLSKVKNQIEQTNGVPTDPWGTPYQCTLGHPLLGPKNRLVIYSLGPDAVISEDDVILAL